MPMNYTHFRLKPDSDLRCIEIWEGEECLWTVWLKPEDTMDQAIQTCIDCIEVVAKKNGGQLMSAAPVKSEAEMH